MLVIGDPELQFRVNVGPTTNDATQENYGSFTICQPYRRPAPAGMREAPPKASFRILQDEIPHHARTVPAAWLTGYFHACPAAAALRACRLRQQARPAIRAGIKG